MEIITVKSHKHETSADAKDNLYECKDDVYHCSPDTEFMKMSHEVDMTPPSTWSKFSQSLQRL